MSEPPKSPLGRWIAGRLVRLPIPARLRPAALFVSGEAAMQGYLAAVDQGTISLTNFVAAIVLARQVTPTDFGVYGVGFLLLLLIRAVQEGVTIQPVNALGAGLDADSFRRYATSTAIIQIALAGATSLVAWLAGWALTALGQETAGSTVSALVLVSISWQMQEFIRRSFYARGRVASAVANTAVASAVRLGILLQLARAGGLSFRAGLDAIGWGALLAVAVGALQARAFWTARTLDVRSAWRRNWSFGRWVAGGSVANWGASEFYPILAAGMISFAAAGAYRALQNLMAPAYVLVRTIDTYLVPRGASRFERGGKAGVVGLMRSAYLLSGVPILGWLLLATLFPLPLLRLFYGEKYLAFAPGALLMSTVYVLSFLYIPLQSMFKAVRWTPPVFVANLAATVSMFTLGVLAIHTLGLYGAIAGQALSGLVICAILWTTWLVRPVPQRGGGPS